MRAAFLTIGLIFILLEFWPFSGSSRVQDHLGVISSPEAPVPSVMEPMFIESAVEAEPESASDPSQLVALATAKPAPTSMAPNSFTSGQQLALQIGPTVTSGQLEEFMQSAGVQLVLLRFDSSGAVASGILPGSASGIQIRVDDNQQIRNFLEDHRKAHVWIELDPTAASLAGVAPAEQLLYHVYFIAPLSLFQQFPGHHDGPLIVAIQDSPTGLELVPTSSLRSSHE